MAEPVISIKIDLSEIEQAANAFAMAATVGVDEIYKGMDKGLDILEDAIVVRTPSNQGILRGSIATDIYGEGAAIVGEVFTPEKYGAAVEFGRKPGKWPPRDAIKLWVIQKQIAEDEKEADQIAFLIARAIGEGTTTGIMKGGEGSDTGGARMFEEGTAFAEPLVLQIFEDVNENILERLRRML